MTRGHAVPPASSGERSDGHASGVVGMRRGGAQGWACGGVEWRGMRRGEWSGGVSYLARPSLRGPAERQLQQRPAEDLDQRPCAGCGARIWDTS